MSISGSVPSLSTASYRELAGDIFKLKESNGLAVTAPQLAAMIPDEELLTMARGDPVTFPWIACHTQADERAVQNTAATAQMACSTRKRSMLLEARKIFYGNRSS
ncbi:hypothetical protein Ciccas_004884 [Cichlidogyrus casuarinus]|uniref:Uncharacterized protein n=1 Tax=Cichlidogyrus casuarinus TaxID=1844966 RepID=A0ABD2QDR7_9PLAT